MDLRPDLGHTSPLLRADILVVDDTPANLELLMAMLEANAYGVRVATGGAHALQAVDACAPDLVMLDVDMPDPDGYEVCRRLKEGASTRSIPVIFISAHDDVLDKVRAFRVGGADYVTKPFQFEEVLARVEYQLALRRLQRDLETKNEELERRNRQLTEWQQRLLASRQRAAYIFSAMADVLPGTVLDERYRLEAKIGSGGFGAVFRATHLGLDRKVAVKVFQPSAANATESGLERFRREGMSGCRVAHPNAVAIFDSGVTWNGIPYLVMELLEGRTLAAELKARTRLPPRRCAEIVAPLCDALAAAHAAGIIHRDVKPENVMLHEDAGREVVKVVDFGLARLLADDDEGESVSRPIVVGTTRYMAPERLRGEPYDGRADVYSVGVMLYEMLTGRLPFGAHGTAPMTMAMAHVSGTPRPLRECAPETSVAIEKVVMSSLEKDPRRRPEARELKRRFLSALDAPP